jgi:YHS domain-containing protein
VLVRSFLLFLLFLFLARAVWRLVTGVVQGASGGDQPTPAQRSTSHPAVKMVRDPVCGTYVVPGKALELARGRETLYFCSEKCRDEYFQKR